MEGNKWGSKGDREAGAFRSFVRLALITSHQNRQGGAGRGAGALVGACPLPMTPPSSESSTEPNVGDLTASPRPPTLHPQSAIKEAHARMSRVRVGLAGGLQLRSCAW